jgi:PPK2 family polyphosphate:nucleotide phosphotransferase
MAKTFEMYRVKPNDKVELKKWDANETNLAPGDKTTTKKRTEKINDELEELQEKLFAEHKRKVLIVLQGMDTSGKDGVIRSVFDGVNPQGVKVAAFKVPTPEELDRDFLWRVHKQAPGKGEITIFNRSHYEDVLVVRVHNLVSQEVWSKRYEQIVSFEKHLAETGTTILKFYLHITKDEQKERLQARLDDTTKHWKFSVGDLKERALWNDYQKAYEDALTQTSTVFAPWYIVPANRKWYRDWVIVNVLVDTLKRMKLQYPTQTEDLRKVKIV